MESCRQCRNAADDDELCGECRGRLDRCRGLLPEHIAGANKDGDAWLIDPWGRAHPLEAAGSVIGRAAEAAVTLAHETVSREHARLWRRDAGRWAIEDLGSKNGTTAASQKVDIAAIADRTAVVFGKVPMWFELERGDRPVASPVSTVLESSGDRLIAALVSPDGLRLELRSTAGDTGVALASTTGGPPWTEVGVPALELALLSTLVERTRANPGAASDLARCVPTRELAAKLPFRTPYPDDQNVRQLVRRTRVLLSSIGVERLIESRPPNGYLVVWPLA